LRCTLQERGFAYAGQFSWEKTAAALVKVIVKSSGQTELTAFLPLAQN